MSAGLKWISADRFLAARTEDGPLYRGHRHPNPFSVRPYSIGNICATPDPVYAMNFWHGNRGDEERAEYGFLSCFEANKNQALVEGVASLTPENKLREIYAVRQKPVRLFRNSGFANMQVAPITLNGEFTPEGLAYIRELGLPKIPELTGKLDDRAFTRWTSGKHVYGLEGMGKELDWISGTEFENDEATDGMLYRGHAHPNPRTIEPASYINPKFPPAVYASAEKWKASHFATGRPIEGCNVCFLSCFKPNKGEIIDGWRETTLNPQHHVERMYAVKYNPNGHSRFSDRMQMALIALNGEWTEAGLEFMRSLPIPNKPQLDKSLKSPTFLKWTSEGYGCIF
ncbi:MAG: hypothetical protein AB7G06_07520 [Bdellovibrionales bacterium]